jgi:tetratricopeptide (TPR) repeat protein
MEASAGADGTSGREEGRKRAVVGVVLLAAVACVWIPTLRCGFVQWDDPLYVLKNPDVAHPDVARILSPSTTTLSDWTPVVTFAYAAQYAIAGASPLVFHATGVLLHLVCVVLLYRLLRNAGLAAVESAAAAALFGIHPLQVESVTWVSSQKNLLAAAFGFVFLRAHLAARPVSATVWLVLALGSKGTAVAFPLAAAAATVLRVGNAAPSRKSWAWIGAWIALAVLRGLVSTSAQTDAVAGTAGLGFAARTAAMGCVLLKQARQFVAPYDLAPLYDWPVMSWTDARVLASWAGVTAIAAAVVFVVRRDRTLLFCAALAATALLPTLNILPAPYLQADRYAHVALAGVAALAVAALRPLSRAKPWAPAAFLAAWAAVLLVPATIGREATWQGDETLWNDACLRAPENGVAWANLGATLLEAGRLDDAGAALERAAQLPHPHPATVSANLGFVAYRKGDRGRAAALLEKSLSLDADDGRAHGLLGRIRSEEGRQDEAGRHLEAAARFDPDAPATWLYRAEWHVRSGDLAAARADVERADALPGGAKIVASAAAAIECLEGHADRALALLRDAAPGTPDDVLRGGLAQKLVYLGREDAARALTPSH